MSDEFGNVKLIGQRENLERYGIDFLNDRERLVVLKVESLYGYFITKFMGYRIILLVIGSVALKFE